MSKRKPPNSNSSSKSRKKPLFSNAVEFHNKRPSCADLSFVESNYQGFLIDNSFKVNSESTPHPAPSEQLKTCSTQKLQRLRKRGKAKRLSFELSRKKLGNSGIKDCERKDGIDPLDNDNSNVNNVRGKLLTSNPDQINDSDLLHSETIDDICLNDTIIPESPIQSGDENFNGNIVPLEGEDTFGDSTLINCLLGTPPQKSIDTPSHKCDGLSPPLIEKGNDRFNSRTKERPIVHESAAIKNKNTLDIKLFHSKKNQRSNTFSPTEIKNKETLTLVGLEGEDNKSCNDSRQSNLLEVTDDSMFENLQLTQIIHDSVPEASKETFYGLPLEVKDMFIKDRGISKLYDWQDECLRLGAIEKRRNLVYSLPTSGGKTLVAEILMLRELLVREKSALLVLPYVSIVQEKVRGLSRFAVDLGFHVEEYAASKGSLPPKKRRKKKTVYIATIEKANAIVNSFIELERTEELGMVVVDELHMIGDGGGRGSLLEILLAKIMFKCPDLQIVGMSATLGNMEEIQTFLNAEVYHNNFRPVELTEYVKVEDEIYLIDTNAKCEEELLKLSRKVKHPKGLHSSLAARDPDHMLSLALEVIPKNSCMVFCPTKKNCQNVALMVAKSLPKELLDWKKEERHSLLKIIHQTSKGICKVLAATIPYGLAYHHSGLTLDERHLIEEAYSSGVLCLLCCTSTLAAGVNLPAKRVILRSPYVGNKFMSRSQYKQMIGRAGRAGFDNTGESILILQAKDRRRAFLLLDGPVNNCRSSLFYEEGKGLRQLILSLLGLKICSLESEIESFLQMTLYHIQQRSSSDYNELSCIKTEIEQLLNLGLVDQKTSKDNVITLQTTELGCATLKGCVNIDLAPFIYEQLMRALEGLVLTNELHLLYLVTPLDQVSNVQVDWMVFYRQVNKLSELEVKAATFIGVVQNVLSRKATSQRCPKDSYDIFVYKRFYLTLMVQSMLKNKSIWEVSETFNTSRGFIQNLFTSTMAFLSLMIHFTEELKELWALKLLFQALSTRMVNSKNSDIAPLLDIPGVKVGRAKQLYSHGYRTLQHLAGADPKTICKEIEHLPRRQAELMVSTAKMILVEKVESLREEADEIAAIPKATEKAENN